jgi:hypothetical protein
MAWAAGVDLVEVPAQSALDAGAFTEKDPAATHRRICNTSAVTATTTWCMKEVAG